MHIRKATDYIVVHCSATPESQDITAETIRRWHLAKGWRDIGYHYVIRRNGKLEIGRPLAEAGAHVKGYNRKSIGICLVGGRAADSNKGENNFTREQLSQLAKLVEALLLVLPARVTVLGHRDLSPDNNGDGEITREEWLKECPCFDVQRFISEALVYV